VPGILCGNDAYKPKRRIKIITCMQLPSPGVKCVKRVVTDLAVLDITPHGFKLLERAPGISVDEIRSKTAGKLIIEGEIPEMKI
jgi:3-oxoacid CoA-transferase subunit B